MESISVILFYDDNLFFICLIVATVCGIYSGLYPGVEHAAKDDVDDEVYTVEYGVEIQPKNSFSLRNVETTIMFFHLKDNLFLFIFCFGLSYLSGGFKGFKIYRFFFFLHFYFYYS